MSCAPAEMSSLEAPARECVVVLIDGRGSRQPLQAVKDLPRVVVGLVGKAVFSERFDPVVGLVEPDGAPPIAVGAVLRIVGGNGGEGNEGGEEGS